MPKGGKDDRHRCQKCKWSTETFDELFWCDWSEMYVDADYSCENYCKEGYTDISYKEEKK